MHQMNHNTRKLPKLNKHLNIYKRPSITNSKSLKHSPSPPHTSPPPSHATSVCYQQMSLLLTLWVAYTPWQMCVLQLLCAPRHTLLTHRPVTNPSRIHSCTPDVLLYLLLLCCHPMSWVLMASSEDDALPGLGRGSDACGESSGNVKRDCYSCCFHSNTYTYQLQKFLLLSFMLATFLSKPFMQFLSYCSAQLMVVIFLFSMTVSWQKPSRLYCVFLSPTIPLPPHSCPTHPVDSHLSY